MERDYLGTLVLLVVCGYLAHRLIRWLWPIIEQRKSLTPLQMLERAAKAPLEEHEREQQHQMTKYV